MGNKLKQDEQDYLREGEGCAIWAGICIIIAVSSAVTAVVIYFWG